MRIPARDGGAVRSDSRQLAVCLVLLFPICGLLHETARAAVVTLNPIKDNTLYQSDTGSLSNGSGQYIFAGRTAQPNSISRRRAVFAFDIAGNIAPGVIIQNVTLTLHMSRTRSSTPRTLLLHRLLADWGEGSSDASGGEGSGAPASSGDATWIHTFFTFVFWATPGGDFSPTISSSQAVGGFGSYTWPSTPQLVADVQDWLDTPSTNFGWILIGVENVATTAKRFDSREHPSPSVRPVLTIEFAAGACCFPNLSCNDTTEAACADQNGDYLGDGSSCGGDIDGDGVSNRCDNCIGAANPDQGDCNGDGEGDACETDPGEGDADSDGVCDADDPCPLDEQDDSDGDGVCDSDDICPGGDDSVDGDNDGVPDACDPCPIDPFNDLDSDGVCDSDDNCPTVPNANQQDVDADGLGDACDACPADNPDDSDGDGVCDSEDVCPGGDDGIDTDDDGQPDACDPCPADNPDDLDGDGVCGSDDLCPDEDDTADEDGNGIPDCLEKIPTVSAWGLVIIALLLLAGGKIYFGRRQAVT